jgi:hypothetical protein
VGDMAPGDGWYAGGEKGRWPCMGFCVCSGGMFRPCCEYWLYCGFAMLGRRARCSSPARATSGCVRDSIGASSTGGRMYRWLCPVGAVRVAGALSAGRATFVGVDVGGDVVGRGKT